MVKPIAIFALLAGCSAASGTLIYKPGGAGSSSDASTLGDGGAGNDGGNDGGLGDAATSTPGQTGNCRRALQAGFLDQFAGDALDPTHWLVAHGNLPQARQRAGGGFVRDNVAVSGGQLLLTVRGDRYTGPIRGIDIDGEPRADGKRTGAAIATRDLFMSATYQWEGLLSAPPGVTLMLVAQRDAPEDGFIAVSAPGRDAEGQPSYAFATGRAEGPSQASVERTVALPFALDDGLVHRLRFDWHTNADMPQLDFWGDTELLDSAEGSAPGRAARAWLVAFVPDDAVADFDTARISIDNAFVTTFSEEGDQCRDGELASPVLEEP